MQFTDELKLTLGDNLTESITDYFAGNPVTVTPLYSDKINTEKVSGKIGLDYTPNDNWLVYASIATGFKSGGYNGAAASTYTQLEPYQEEELLAYEIGFKATLLDSTMQLNGAVITTTTRTSRFSTASGTRSSALVNVPESTVDGAELDMHWRPLQGLDVKLGVNYLNTRVDKFEGMDTLTSMTL